jgi:peptidoglycan/xylan/chitin deacetylase (PgdA/CDA1 family)
VRTVLVLHGVGDRRHRHDIGWQTFDRLIDDLRVSRVRFITDLASLPSRDPEVVLAFDDSTLDQMAVAAKLDDSAIPAVFFISVGLLGSAGRMAPADVHGLSGLGHRVASHGFAHVRLDRLRDADLRREVVDSRAKLEDLTGEAVTAFAPPHGVLSVSARALAATTYRAIRIGRWGIDLPTGDRLGIPIVPVTEETARSRWLVETVVAGDLVPALRAIRLARSAVPRSFRPIVGRVLNAGWRRRPAAH